MIPSTSGMNKVWFCEQVQYLGKSTFSSLRLRVCFLVSNSLHIIKDCEVGHTSLQCEDDIYVLHKSYENTGKKEIEE